MAEVPAVNTPLPQPGRTASDLRAAAENLEASFLAEMLKAAGLGQSRTSFGGGAGEDQFASLLVEEQARLMVKAGGIGLAQSIFNVLKEQAHVANK
ncbi:MAG: rod-binding protein [Pseudomonadota bacterium]